ncbi:MAG: protein kinase [Chloroflexi bacterium]|nr:protein kinase [Chloroflexota bacterium]
MSELIGKSLGSYRILEQIGVGGMATIYKAYQPGMDRYVAIKVLPHYLAKDEQFVQRFQQEARAIAKLEHAHILPVFDYGEHEGVTYIAMRYIKAGTLKEYMSNGGLPLAEISRIIGQIGSALDYAHREGIIHRDVKPGNVLIDDQGNTYLTDFGLARMMVSSKEFTASGVSVGTPAYMSPEQGKGAKVDRRSDIYALGVVLFEMATGQVPFEAETPLAVLLKHITDPLPLPHMLKPNLPEPVERVILRALAKEPDDRFQSAGEMAQALATAVRRTAQQETIATAPAPPHIQPQPAAPTPETVSLIARAQRSWQTTRGKATIIGGLAAILIIFGFLVSRLNKTEVAITDGREGTVAATAVPTTTTEEPVSASPAPTQSEAQPTESAAGAAESNMTETEAIATAVPQDAELAASNPATGHAEDMIAPILNENDLETTGDPSWSPNGQQIVFAAIKSGENPDRDNRLYIVNADGSELTLLPQYDNDLYPAWGPDGQWLAFRSSCDLVRIRLNDFEEFYWIDGLAPEWCVTALEWSPDSRWLVFSLSPIDQQGLSHTRQIRITTEAGEAEMVANFTINNNNCLNQTAVAYSPDGSKIAYVDGDCQPQLMDIETRATMPTDEFPYWWTSSWYPQWTTFMEVETAVSAPEAAAATPVEQARAFAEPILAAIAGHPPDYADDFNAPGSGWSSGSLTDGSKWGYEDGAYVITAPYLPQGGCCVRGYSDTMPYFSDFVLELDAQFISDEYGAWSVLFRDQHGTEPQGHYGFGLLTDGAFRVWANINRTHVGDLQEADSLTPAFKPGYENNHLTIVAIGPEFAFYLNGEPLWFIHDESLSEGRFSLAVENWVKDSSLQAQFDNLEIWDISGLAVEDGQASLNEQARAFAEPILAAIADTPPDYTDDFSDSSTGWPIGAGISGHSSHAEGETGYLDGEFFLSVVGLGNEEMACYGGESSVSFPADFVLEIDGRFLPDDFPNNDDWQIQFRKWGFGNFYVLIISQDGYLNLIRQENGEPVDLAAHGGAPVVAEPDTNHIQIIAVGMETAVYANGEPVFYVDDPGYSDQYGAGSINLGVCNLGDAAREVRWDNLKIWDVSKPSSESKTTVSAGDVQVTQLAVYEELVQFQRLNQP